MYLFVVRLNDVESAIRATASELLFRLDVIIGIFLVRL